MKMVVLYRRSGIECWEWGYAQNAVPFEPDSSFECASDKESLARVKLLLPNLAQPYEILVNNQARRSQSQWCQSTVWSKPFPPHSLYLIEEAGIVVAAPWFCYLNMAARLTFPLALLFGMELCGAYSTLPFARTFQSDYRPSTEEVKRGYVKRAPLTTPPVLLRGISGALPPNSRSRVLTAAQYVAANSHSPGESRCHERLFIPSTHGGYTLPCPLLNVTIELPPDLQRVAGMRNYVLDFLYSKEHLVVEYDGGYHWNGEQRLDDNLRELILNTLGYRVVRIDKHQFESLDAMNIGAGEIARQLGVRLRKPSAATVKKRRALQMALQDYSFNYYDV